MRIEWSHAADALAGRGTELDELALMKGSVFLSSAWMDAWTTAFGPKSRYLMAVDASDRLRAAACITPMRPIGTQSAANLETGDWTVTGSSAEARRLVWRHLANQAGSRLRLTAVPDTAEDAQAARAALSEAGYRVAARPAVENPRLQLPSSWDDLLASVSRNARSQYRRRRRALEHLGRLELRTADADSLESDFERFIQLEGGGWKGEAKTSIRASPQRLTLYRRFAQHAASRGWLRLQLLELNGVTIAVELNCAFAGGLFMMKTAYDEKFARLSPGLALESLTIESAIADGLRFCDFLGMAEEHKLRWGSVVHPHVTISAHRGPAAPVAHRYHAQLRPRLKVARSTMQARLGRPRPP